MKKEISDNILNRLLEFQQSEITEYHSYKKLAHITKDTFNKEQLSKISNEELHHYNIWKSYTNTEVKPDKKAVFKYYWISRIFGLTFGVKLMEKGEKNAQVIYNEVADSIPEAKTIMKEEDNHEHALIDMLNEEKLEYIGSMVLGLNDALVELTGALAGFTFALQNSRLIALTGLITGISASFSMAASEYLATRSEIKEGEKNNAAKSALYTGLAYIFTVVFLILPFLVLNNFFASLILTLIIAVLIIFLFNFYISVAKDYNFKRRFFEMAAISLGVAAISFVVGIIIRNTLGVDI
ncbi:MAG: rubrerythrin family protein [Clostridiales bacterium]|nr:rubrerythrin family protein [Clostridiales bacterium]